MADIKQAAKWLQEGKTVADGTLVKVGEEWKPYRNVLLYDAKLVTDPANDPDCIPAWRNGHNSIDLKPMEHCGQVPIFVAKRNTQCEVHAGDWLVSWRGQKTWAWVERNFTFEPDGPMPAVAEGTLPHSSGPAEDPGIGIRSRGRTEVIPYNGTPITPQAAAVAILAGRHALVSFAHPEQMAIVAEVCESFALDNGAFSHWKSGSMPDWNRFYEWVGAASCVRLRSHTGCHRRRRGCKRRASV